MFFNPFFYINNINLVYGIFHKYEIYCKYCKSAITILTFLTFRNLPKADFPILIHVFGHHPGNYPVTDAILSYNLQHYVLCYSVHCCNPHFLLAKAYFHL